MNSQKVVVSRSRNPFELFLLFACAVSGLGFFIEPSKASSTTEGMPIVVQYIYYVGLMLGGVVSLIGAIGPKLIYLYIERLGLILLSGSVLGLASILVTRISRPLAFPVVLLVFFSLSCLERIRQVSKEVRQVKEDI